MATEEVTLEIEGIPMKCQKEVLISNSDYFKAMFEGNFIEKKKDTIQIKGVDLKAMNIILNLIWDESHYIEDEDILMVLQASCMLQFNEIRNICLKKIIEILCVKNCLKIWLVAEELDLKLIHLQAKSMALAEFMMIKETGILLELSLPQLHKYLGNVNLRTDNELSVFQTVMKWWYENSDSCDNSTSALLKLLSSIDFRSFPSNHFEEILTYPGVAGTEIGEIIKCLHQNLNDVSNFPKNSLEAAALLRVTKSRTIPGYPCILVKSNAVEFENKGGNYLDVYRRKRPYKRLEPKEKDGFHIVYLDHVSGKFKEFFAIAQKLEGFSLINYKEYVFMYGGEYALGKGEWNRGFWAYDTIRERWRSKSKMPFPRRHFETCIVGSRIFIIGGTGLYRINQENMFWYDYKNDVWSKEKSLPCFDRQMKCTNFLNKLFLFSSSNSSGYFLDDHDNWITIQFPNDKSSLSTKSGFILFSYKDKLYIKGEKLVELVMTHNKLMVSSIKEVTDRDYSKIETTVCNNLAFTLYQFPACESTTCQTYSLEKYNLDSGDIELIFENLSEHDSIQTKDGAFVIAETLQMFSFPHFTIVEGDELVNDSF